jgi:hypothetical protein
MAGLEPATQGQQTPYLQLVGDKTKSPASQDAGLIFFHLSIVIPAKAGIQLFPNAKQEAAPLEPF